MLCIGYFGVLVGITWVSDMYSRLGLVNFTSLHKTYIHKKIRYIQVRYSYIRYFRIWNLHYFTRTQPYGFVLFIKVKSE